MPGSGTLNLKNGVIHSVVAQVTWISSPGRFLIGWGSFLEGESLLSQDERKEKMDEDDISTKHGSITADVEGVYVRRLLISASYLEDQHCDGNTHKHPGGQ